jgi:lipoate-protein ligase A
MRAAAHAIAPLQRVEHVRVAAQNADAELLDAALLRSQDSEPLLRLWINEQCLVTTRRLSARDEFTAAARASSARGWPVLVRESGGTTVAHGPDVLNVSLAFVASTHERGIEAAFLRLRQLLIPALRKLGVDADMGEVPGSYCDGRFNVRVAGRKVAGTACRIRSVAGRTGVLAHASLLVDGDPSVGMAAVGAFERRLGLHASYRADALGTLAMLGVTAPVTETGHAGTRNPSASQAGCRHR